MSLVEDIREIYQEIGVAITILRPGGDIAEHIDSEPDAGSSFIRRGYFPATSQAVPGDIIEIPQLGRKFLIVLKVPDLFENAAFEFSALLYQINMQGHISRLTQARDSSYRLALNEAETQNPAHAFLGTSDISLQFDKFGTIEIRKGEICFPGFYDVQAMDRFTTIEGEKYRIGAVQTGRFEAIGTAFIERDTR